VSDPNQWDLDQLRRFDLDTLRKEGKFGDFMLVAWGSIEESVDLAVGSVFKLQYDDEIIADYILDNSFQKKARSPEGQILDFIRRIFPDQESPVRSEPAFPR
jgi:hypothetical protein